MKQAICILVLALLGCAAGMAKEKKTEAKKPAAETKPAAPIAGDAQLQEFIADYQLIENEIGRIENATGEVTIAVSAANLRERAKVKAAHIRDWTKEHGVPDGWAYDPATNRFLPPALPSPKEAEKEKPAAEAKKPAAPSGK